MVGIVASSEIEVGLGERRISDFWEREKNEQLFFKEKEKEKKKRKKKKKEKKE